MIRFLFTAAVYCTASFAASAQEVIPDFYKGAGVENNRVYVNQNFSEHIDPFNGALQLHYVDINLPGNGGFDIQVTRSYNSASVAESNPSVYFGSAGIGWSVHFGRILYKTSVGACGGSAFADVMRNAVLELPDGSTQILALSATADAAFTSTRRWRASCTGGAMVAYSPNGVRYDFTQAVGVPSGSSAGLGALYATGITDRNGNHASITYTAAGSPEVSSITTNDGRRVDFSYFALTSSDSTRRISTITSIDSTGNHTFTYGYSAVTGGGFQLTSIVRPDGSRWLYRYLGNLNATVPGGFQLNGVTYPEGGTVSYGYGSSSGDYVYFDSASNPQSRSVVVKTKTTSDGGSWSFSYAPGGIGSYDTTTVNTPSGTVTYKHVGPNYATSGSLWMVGLLIQKQIGSLQTENYDWTPQAISNQDFKRPGAWQTTRLDTETNAPRLSIKSVVRNGASHTTTFSEFDSFGNPATVVESGPNGGSRTTSLTYYTNVSLWILRQVKNQSVSGGVQVTRAFDGTGNLLSIDRNGVSTNFSYTASGDLSQAVFPRLLIHNYSNYMRGIARAETQPEGISLFRNVDDIGNILAETNGRGQTSGYTYDRLGRMTRISPPLGNATTIAHGETTKSASRGGLTESTQYDGFGRPISITLGSVTQTYRYDSLGRKTFVSNPGSSAGTSYQYDILDRVTTVTNADGTDRLIAFAAASKAVRDERGNTTTYRFRAYGDPDQQLLMSVESADVSTNTNVSLARNAKDLVTSMIQGGLGRSYAYDGRGYLTSVVNPETGTTIYGRDDSNNMVSRTVGASGTTTYSYDGQNRVVSETYPSGTPAVFKSYTGTHKLASVTSSIATRNYGYDSNDNLTSESLNIDGLLFRLNYGYNSNDQLSSLTYPRSGRMLAYSPDVLGRPTSVSGFVNGVGYWASGQISQINYANGTTSTYGQNIRLWPSSFQTTGGATNYLRSAYGYDGLGNLTSIVDDVDGSYNRTLGYDRVNRLTTAQGPWGAGSLVYDGTGNLRSQTLGANNLSYGYTASNQLGSVSGSRSAIYSYDAYGNVTSNGTRSFGYDGSSNMVCANCGDASGSQYQYDGMNHRVSVTKAGVKTYEFYGFNGNLLTEYTPNASNKLVEYAYLGNKRIAQIASSIQVSGAGLTVTAGRALPLTVSVNGNAPTGTVTFYDGSTLLATASLVSGVASANVTLSTPGVRTITVSYSGDGNNAASSTTLTINVLLQPELLIPILDLILDDDT